MRSFLENLGRNVAAGLLLLVAAVGIGYTGTQNLPIPSDICAAGQIMHGVDGNHVTCTDTPTIGTSITVGSAGTALTQVVVYEEEITPASVAAQTCVEEGFTVTGLRSGDTLIVNMLEEHSPPASLVSARYSEDDLAAITFCNPSGGAATPVPGTIRIVAIRS